MLRLLTFFVILSASPTLFAQSVEAIVYAQASGAPVVVHKLGLEAQGAFYTWKYELDTSGFPFSSRDIRTAEVFQGSCIQVSRFQTQGIGGFNTSVNSKAYIFCPGLIIEREQSGGDVLHNESDADFAEVLDRALIELGVSPKNL